MATSACLARSSPNSSPPPLVQPDRASATTQVADLVRSRPTQLVCSPLCRASESAPHLRSRQLFSWLVHYLFWRYRTQVDSHLKNRGGGGLLAGPKPYKLPPRKGATA